MGIFIFPLQEKGLFKSLIKKEMKNINSPIFSYLDGVYFLTRSFSIKQHIYGIVQRTCTDDLP
jgi:hypothetical protein